MLYRKVSRKGKVVKMEQDYLKLQQSIATIASELFRFQKVFEKMVKKLDMEDQGRYISQFNWFSKKVFRASDDADLKLLAFEEGQEYDEGMAVTPLNIDDFESSDKLCIEQMIEPIIMKNDEVFKVGTVILRRVEK